MAEKHDHMVSLFKAKLVRKKYNVNKKSPFVDYHPDIYATNSKEIIVEVEIENSLQNDHTLKQLTKMYEYLKKSKKRLGILCVPKSAVREAFFLVKSVFGDRRIEVKGFKF